MITPPTRGGPRERPPGPARPGRLDGGRVGGRRVGGPRENAPATAWPDALGAVDGRHQLPTALEGAQQRALRSAVALHLRRRGSTRAPEHELARRHCTAAARKSRRARTAARLGLSERRFDDAVLARVVRDDHAAPSGARARRWTAGSASARTSSSSFTATRRAWKTRRAGCPPWRRTAAGSADRTTSASAPVVVTGRAAHHGQRNPPGETSLAVGGEQPGQLGFGPRVHEVRRRRAPRRGPCACRAERRRGRRSHVRAGRAEASSRPDRRAHHWPTGVDPHGARHLARRSNRARRTTARSP